MKKKEHGKTFDRDAANPPAFEVFHNTVTEGYPEHWHTAIEIIMPVTGAYDVIVGKDCYELQEGDIIMINSGVVHGMKFVSPGERIVMLVEPGSVDNQEEMETIFLRLPPVYFKKADEEDPFYLFLRSQILELVREYDRVGSGMSPKICSDLKELFSEFGRKGFSDANAQNTFGAMKQQEYIEAVLHACHYINIHYMENLTLEEVAAVSGFSKFHFTRIFKQYMNMTFYEYLNSKRVKRAEELLYNKKMSITDVAMNSGFSSLSAFNRTFKTVKGCSPSDYRRQRESMVQERYNTQLSCEV